MRRFGTFSSFALSLLCAGLVACSDDDGTGPVTPPAPTGVAAVAAGPSSVTVNFNAVTGATGYVVQRAPGSGGDFATVGTPAAPPFVDSGLEPNTAYRYQVAAVVNATQGDFSAAVNVTTSAPGAAVIDADITTNRTLSADTVYTLRGFVHVANGATLTIPAGTRILGDFNTLGSSLFIMRGARIVANGTADKPIVFTSSRTTGQQAGDWGGVIIVGNGIINRGQPVILEGSGTGAANPPVDYSGGTNNADNSGTLRYVRIEYAGYATAPDTELNTLTLAAVGSGTTIEYVQGLEGLDDTFEFFGGAVDAKYLISYESGDDHFDMSEGYVGRIQYAIAYQSRQIIPRAAAGNPSSDPQGIENDGCAGANCNSGQNSLPLNVPIVANFTLVGPPTGVFAGTSGGVGMMLRRGTGGYYVNGVVTRWERAAISLRDQSTLNRLDPGDLMLKNIYVTQTGPTFQAASGTTVQGQVDPAANAITEGGATTAQSLFLGLPTPPATSAAQLDWTPAAGSAIATGGLTTFPAALAARAGTFITPTAYRGAANPAGPKWWQGWTNYK